MSTRCNVVIKDKYGELVFYRHSDGYPEGVKKTLTQFLDLVKSGKIRGNVEQAAGWLILIGHEEYREEGYCGTLTGPGKANGFSDWKVGAYEPSQGIHGDIEYLYEIDLDAKTLKGWEHDGDNKRGEVKI